MSTNKADRRADLEMSLDVGEFDKRGFAMLIGWYEKWRIGLDLRSERGSAVRFWREQVMAKSRSGWQLRQWGEALAWYLRWLAICKEHGIDARTIPERMKVAVLSAGARRGHSAKTRKGYASYVARFGAWVDDVKAAQDLGKASEWLRVLVEEEKLSFSTQKVALKERGQVMQS